MSLLLILFLNIAQAAPIKVLPLGDSLTAGGYSIAKTWYVGSGYRAKLKEELSKAGIEIDFVGSMSNGYSGFLDKEHEGYSGNRIDEVAAKFEPNLVALKPDWVLLHLGTNDIMQNHQLKTAPARLFDLIKQIQKSSPNSVIFLASVITSGNLSYKMGINAFNASIRPLAKALERQDPKKFVWVEMHNQTHLRSSEFTDTVHPTTVGYEKMGSIWARAIQDYRKR